MTHYSHIIARKLPPSDHSCCVCNFKTLWLLNTKCFHGGKCRTLVCHPSLYVSEETFLLVLAVSFSLNSAEWRNGRNKVGL